MSGPPIEAEDESFSLGEADLSLHRTTSSGETIHSGEADGPGETNRSYAAGSASVPGVTRAVGTGHASPTCGHAGRCS